MVGGGNFQPFFYLLITKIQEKMEKVKIKAKSTSMYGKKINLPIDGEVKIDENGILEVSSECANLLVEKTENYSFVEEKEATTKKDDKKKSETEKSKKSETTKKSSKKVEEVEEDEEETEDETSDEETRDDSDDSEDEEEDEDVTYTKEDLNALEITDLIEILKEANISEDKYEKFKTKKGLLINFILKTLNNA